jgi:hypothetical protein
MRFLVTLDGSDIGVKVEVKPLISTSEMLERSRAMSQRLQERVR